MVGSTEQKHGKDAEQPVPEKQSGHNKPLQSPPKLPEQEITNKRATFDIQAQISRITVSKQQQIQCLNQQKREWKKYSHCTKEWE